MRGKQMRWVLSWASVFVLAAYLLSGLMINQAVSAISENIANKVRKTVIIDAGHGGEDGGATSCTGVIESEINLQIALKLNDLLRFLGIKTSMIRTTDRSVYTQGETIAQKKVSDLKERVRMINSIENSVLISIHQNFFPDSKYKGAQVFYSEMGESADFARQMQETFVSVLNKGSNRMMKKAENIYIMENIQSPGILIECGFISNFEEEALLCDENYQRKVCSVIASVTSQYLNAEREHT